MLMSFQLPPPLYFTVRIAFATFLMEVLSLDQLAPRTQERSDPGDTSRPVQASSKSMSVLLVPSTMSGILTPSGFAGPVVVRLGWYGRMPSQASPPCPLLRLLTG